MGATAEGDDGGVGMQEKSGVCVWEPGRENGVYLKEQTLLTEPIGGPRWCGSGYRGVTRAWGSYEHRRTCNKMKLLLLQRPKQPTYPPIGDHKAAMTAARIHPLLLRDTNSAPSRTASIIHTGHLQDTHITSDPLSRSGSSDCPSAAASCLRWGRPMRWLEVAHSDVCIGV